MSMIKYQVSKPIEVAAGSAANTTYTAYLDMQSYDACSLQVEWTAGAGGGTLSFKVYGSIQDDTTPSSSVAYQDITNELYGVAAVTGDALALDGDAILGHLKWIKLAATIANKDANTALTIYSRKKKNN